MNTLLLAMFVQIGLTLTIVPFVGLSRIKALRTDPSLKARTAVATQNFPDDIQKIANNYNNQFQLPVLFYVGCLFAFVMGEVCVPLLIAAWAFVIFRTLHTIIHTTYNNVVHRFLMFGGSLLSLVAFWVALVCLAAESPLFSGANPLSTLGG